eukprot:Clim_evm15s35 gene=Clim_evmTU15s35
MAANGRNMSYRQNRYPNQAYPGMPSASDPARERMLGQNMEDQMESENDNMVNQLTGKLTALKSLTINIGDEVRSQNRMLDGMGDDFFGAGALLKSTMGRLDRLIGSQGGSHMCVLVLFVLFVFFIIYMMI